MVARQFPGALVFLSTEGVGCRKFSHVHVVHLRKVSEPIRYAHLVRLPTHLPPNKNRLTAVYLAEHPGLEPVRRYNCPIPIPL